MGNHEFCTECGENNFHNNRPCNPETKRLYEESCKPKKQMTASKELSQIAVEVANDWLIRPVESDLSRVIQSAIDKAILGMMPIEDVKPLLDALKHYAAIAGTTAMEYDVGEKAETAILSFEIKHKDKLK